MREDRCAMAYVLFSFIRSLIYPNPLFLLIEARQDKDKEAEAKAGTGRFTQKRCFADVAVLSEGESSKASYVRTRVSRSEYDSPVFLEAMLTGNVGMRG